MARRKKRDPVGVADVIFGALRKQGLTDQARRLAIHMSWDKAVGPEVAARTSPESFRRGVLLVRAINPTWQNELTYLKRELIAKLNAELGEGTVQDIKIVSGHLPPPPPPAPPKPLPPVRPDERARAESIAESIGDDEVRAIFRRSLENYLRHQRR